MKTQVYRHKNATSDSISILSSSKKITDTAEVLKILRGKKVFHETGLILKFIYSEKATKI